MAIRSSRTSWPTMVRLTSKSTGCSGLARSAWARSAWARSASARSAWARSAAVASLMAVSSSSTRCPHIWVLISGAPSYLGPLSSWSLAAAERGADGDREPDAGERVLAVGGGERDDHADDAPVRVEQRAARAAGVDRRVELDEPGELAVAGVGGPVQAGDYPGGDAVGQGERVADGDDGRPYAGAAADGGGHDHLRQLGRDEFGDVQLRVGTGHGRARRGAVGERDGDGPAAGDDVIRGQDQAAVGHDD